MTLSLAAPRRAAEPTNPFRKLTAAARRVATDWASVERVYDFPLQTRLIAAPLQFTKSGVFAWFVLGATNWDFLTLNERIASWDVQRSRYGRAAEALPDGHRPIHIRRTTRPYGAYEWAARLDAQATPLPAVAGAEDWNTYLGHGQRCLRRTGLDTRCTMVGLWVCPPPSAEAVEDLTDSTEHPRKDAVKILDELAKLDTLMAGREMQGRRATPADMAFLMHRSLSMGLPAPESAGQQAWTGDQLGEFTDRRAWVAPRFGPVTVHGTVGAKTIKRHVVVLSMGVMPDQTWPDRGQDAWMMAADRLGFPIEWSVSGALIKGSALEQAAEYEANRARNVAEHAREHGITPTPATARAIQNAELTLDEVTEGDARTAPRFAGTIRCAVYADTAEEADKRADAVITHSADNLHMSFTRTLDQTRALREFTPGEPRVLKGWTRRFSVGYLAAAMPHIDAEVGTPTGPYLGYTTSRRAFPSDLHYAPEVLNRSGMITASCEPGGGKSSLIGAYAYPAVLAGERTVVYDPSGPLAALTRLPELAPYSAELNLTRAAEGTLSPARLIPVPVPTNYTKPDGELDELEYRRAVKMATAERSQLMFDILRMNLSTRLLREPYADQTLIDAIRTMPEHRLASEASPTEWNPRWVLEALKKKRTKIATSVLRELEDAADFPLGSLIIPSHGGLVEDYGLDDKTLVVVTMPGLEPPPAGSDREDWGIAERQSQPLLHLAAFFAAQFIYSRPRHERKNVFLDENHLMARWGSGRAFNIRIARDSRKWNTGVIASSQDPADHLAIGNLDALVSGCFIGRLPTDTAARRGCQALGISEEYASLIQSLQSGEFLHRDPFRRVARVKIDLDWHPSLKALNTTPGHKREDWTAELEPTPFLDHRLFASQELAA